MGPEPVHSGGNPISHSTNAGFNRPEPGVNVSPFSIWTWRPERKDAGLCAAVLGVPHVVTWFANASLFVAGRSPVFPAVGVYHCRLAVANVGLSAAPGDGLLFAPPRMPASGVGHCFAAVASPSPLLTDSPARLLFNRELLPTARGSRLRRPRESQPVVQASLPTSNAVRSGGCVMDTIPRSSRSRLP